MVEISKFLTDTDTCNQGRCFLPKDQLLQILPTEAFNILEQNSVINDVVLIERSQRNASYVVKLGKYRTSYFFTNGWKNIVKQWNLVAGDAITFEYQNTGGNGLCFTFQIEKQSNAGRASSVASSTGSNEVNLNLNMYH